jgi:hypothetical protein
VPKAAKALRTLAEIGCATTALFFCVATSYEQEAPEPSPEPPIDEPWNDTDWEPEPASIDARVHLHNGTASALTVRLRSLATGTDLDCGAVIGDPGRLLTSALFGPVDAWTLEADANMPIDSLVDEADGCQVGVLSIDGMSDVVLLWDPAGIEFRTIEAGGSAGGEGELSIRALGSGGLQVDDGAAGIVHAMVGREDPEPACAMGRPGDRLTWADPVPAGQFELGGVSEGLDGCLELELAGQAPWYLCVPLDVFPFEVGDALEIAETWGEGGRGLEIHAAADIRSLHVGAGTSVDPYGGITWEAREGCQPDVESRCGTVATVGSVWIQASADTERFEVKPGEWVEQIDQGAAVRTYVAIAQSVAAVRADCAEGPGSVGTDLSFAEAVMGPVGAGE